MAWTVRELAILQTTSRVGSVFSLLGALFIIITFCTSKDFHRPINRLAFYAAFGNIITNVATILSRDGIRAGINSPVCQAQAFIIQWAIPADALFCLAMAWNVYLTVFKKRTTEQLRKLEPYYIGGCYGVPLLIALVFLVYKPKDKPRIYGEATLWCWIGPEWQVLRIAAFYGPIWIVLLITFMIYLLAGRIIFRLRQNLRKFVAQSGSGTSQSRSGNFPGTSTSASIYKPGNRSTMDTIELGKMPPGEKVTRPSPVHNAKPGPNEDVSAFASYSCTVEVGAAKRRNAPRNNAVEANRAAWAYCRCAMLFFLALVITWLPSSINRVYTLRYPYATDMSYNFAAVLVLPCQGFWNGLIYIVTTLPACKKYFGNIWATLKRTWFRISRRRQSSRV